MPDRYIAVAGNIGSGKTSLVAYLSSTYGFQPVFEPFADNPYLDDFYADMSAWAYRSQLWFLAHKFRLHHALREQSGVLVQDRTLFEDAEIFARALFEDGHITARDYATYRELYDVICLSLRPPDLVIYLRCSVPALRRRIAGRGRANEAGIPTAYLQHLDRLYEAWLASWTASPVVVWQSDAQDYVSDLVAQLAFREAMEPFLT